MRSPTSPIRSAGRASLLLLSASLALAACTTGASSVPTTAPGSAADTPPGSVAPSPSATTLPSSSASPTTAPATDETGPSACPTAVDVGVVPSDRLTGVAVDQQADVDKVVFTFGTSTGIPSGTAPTGALSPTSPPFSLSGSGQAVGVAGRTFIAVTFRGMAIADQAGHPSYTGAADLRPNAPAVRELRLVDDFEGVVTWVVGMDGPGCVVVTHLTAPDRVVVAVGH